MADSVAEGEQETVTVAPGTPVATGLGGGAAASGSVGFAILEPPPEITIAAKTGTVVEGSQATFTLTASRAPGADPDGPSHGHRGRGQRLRGTR